MSQTWPKISRSQYEDQNSSFTYSEVEKLAQSSNWTDWVRNRHKRDENNIEFQGNWEDNQTLEEKLEEIDSFLKPNQPSNNEDQHIQSSSQQDEMASLKTRLQEQQSSVDQIFKSNTSQDDQKDKVQLPPNGETNEDVIESSAADSTK